MRWRDAFMFTAALCMAAVSSAGATPAFQLLEVPNPVPGYFTQVDPLAMNNRGQVVTVAFAPLNNGLSYDRALYLWGKDTGYTQIAIPDALKNSGGWTAGINERGDVFVHTWVGLEPPATYLSTQGSGLRKIGTDVTGFQAMDINDAGQVVGLMTGADGLQRAALWQDGVTQSLHPDLAGVTSSWAMSINNQGDVAMSVESADGVNSVIRHADGSLQQVDAMPGSGWHFAVDINDEGMLVGSEGHAGWSTPFLVRPGSAIPVPLSGTVPDANWVATSLNNRGEVVGRSLHTDDHAAYWSEATGFVSLEDLIAPGSAVLSDFSIWRPIDINDEGMILVSLMGHEPTPFWGLPTHWSVLMPVPEPAIWMMGLLGACGLMWVRRRVPM